MKKIVALVLSLVMALSLATVAFAYTTSRVVYDKVGNNADKNVELSVGSVDFVKASKTDKHIGYYTFAMDVAYYGYYKDQAAKDADKVSYVAVADFDETVVYGLEWIMDGNDKEVYWLATDGFYGIPCEQSQADAAVYNNGKFESWIMIDTSAKLANYYTTATAQSATSKLPNCTTAQYLEDGYVDADGNYYVENAKVGTVYALNVDGKIVFAHDVTGDDDYFIPASHIFAKGVKNDKMGYDVATCLVCKGEFACTNNEAVATKTGYKLSNTFAYDTAKAGRVYDANAYDNGYDFAWGQAYAGNYAFCWALKAGTTEEAGKTTTDTTKDGVNSAKTFDAGIAMYVGMSLLSVAGSAVVIGKKKEF